MKKLLSLALISMMAFSLVACGSSSADKENTGDTSSDDKVEDKEEDLTEGDPEFVTISVENGVEEMIDLEVPYNPTRIVFIDYVAFDMCAALGILDNPDVEFLTIQSSMPSYLQEFVPEGAMDLGGLKEYDMEAIMSFEPDIIFTSGRTASFYDEFSMIAPTICSSLDYVPSTYESFETINIRNASIFGLEEEAAELIASYSERLEALTEWAAGQTAMTGIFTGGEMSTLGNESRGSMIYNDLGFENLANDIDSTHGDASSYEVLLLKNPEFLFVLDRDSAIAAEGASTAEELLDNEIVHETTAWKEGKIIYLDPNVWYMCEGGMLAMDIMLTDLEVGMSK